MSYVFVHTPFPYAFSIRLFRMPFSYAFFICLFIRLFHKPFSFAFFNSRYLFCIHKRSLWRHKRFLVYTQQMLTKSDRFVDVFATHQFDPGSIQICSYTSLESPGSMCFSFCYHMLCWFVVGIEIGYYPIGLPIGLPIGSYGLFNSPFGCAWVCMQLQTLLCHGDITIQPSSSC